MKTANASLMLWSHAKCFVYQVTFASMANVFPINAQLSDACQDMFASMDNAFPWTNALRSDAEKVSFAKMDSAFSTTSTGPVQL